jgi:hypothetical protein
MNCWEGWNSRECCTPKVECRESMHPLRRFSYPSAFSFGLAFVDFSFSGAVQRNNAPYEALEAQRVFSTV